ncbi:MAG TPA: glycosyltransferase family 4 protein [Clostridia bacterium]|nr:glycosyltransferase family 4 protein [Clostridia bacterium]
MNIWFFNHYAIPPWFFPLARPYNFAKYLIKKGHNVTVFAASTVHNSNLNLIKGNEKFSKEIIDNINYVYLRTSNYVGNGKSRIINMLQYTLGLFTVTRKISSPDVIIATSVHPLACFAGIKIAKKYNCRCIVEIADLWPLTLIEFGLLKHNSIMAKALYQLEHWIYKNADSIIFTMEGGKDYVAEKYYGKKKIDLNHIYYINNGIDLDIYNNQKIKNVYKDLDLDDDNFFKVLYTGSLGKANYVNYIVETAKIIQDRGYKNIKFIIFGTGYMNEELESYCIDNSLRNVVFKGKVDKKSIPNILSKSSLNIFTGEQIGLYKYGLSLNKMFDYMASGKPTISNIKCGYDNLEKFQCGITVEGGSAETLAEGVLKFYNMSSDEYGKYCTSALNAAKEFDFAKLTDQLENIIINAVQRGVA